MPRRFSWCTVVALVVLLFVATEGLRERSTQVDDQKTLTSRDRGALRFNTKSPEEETTSLPFARSKSPRDRTPQSKKPPSNDRRDDGTSSNTEAKFESSKRSNFRTTKTTEKNVTSDATNSSRRTFGINIDEIKKGEPTINRRNGKRYSTESNGGARAKDEQSVTADSPRETSRRPSSRPIARYEVTERLIDTGGPSVFTATTESSRSRTGRKIQTTFTSRDSKTQIPASRRFANRNAESFETSTVSLRRSTTERIERGTRSGRSKSSNKESLATPRKSQDAVLSESESVRVDVPLALETTTESAASSSATFSQQTTTYVEAGKRSDTNEFNRAGSRRGPERSKGRGRSSGLGSPDYVSPTPRSGRRGSSKFNDLATTEATELNVAWKKNAISRDRSRGADGRKGSERTRARSRSFENAATPVASERDAKRKTHGERNFAERRNRVSEATTRSVDHRGQDQDGRRGRNRSRVNASTPISTKAAATASPETTVVTEVLTTTDNSESPQLLSSTTPAPASSTTASPRTLTTTPRQSTTTSAEGAGRTRARNRGGQGRAQTKEDFFNHGLGFRGRKPSTEGPAAGNDARRPTAQRNDTRTTGNPGWTLRRRPGHSNSLESLPRAAAVPSGRDQTNEVIPSSEQSTSTEIVTSIESSTRRSFEKPRSSTEESTVADGTTTSSPRRGGKAFGFGKPSTDSEESDNYPPEFKARLSQLKISNTKAPAPKTVPRPPVEVKKSTTALFAERSRLKLDLARRLVKPELNIEENDLDATTASSSFSKPKPKSNPSPNPNLNPNPYPKAKPTDETSKLSEFPKPSPPGRRGSTESSQEDREKSSELAGPRKSPEDPSKIAFRPTGAKKGKIIAERMVTSISVEERVEDTTKPFRPGPSVVTVSTEEASATTLEPTNAHTTSRGSKRSKEEGSPISKNAKVLARTHDHITTFKPKKAHAYRSRGRKNQEQSATPNPTTETTLTKGAIKQTSRQKQSDGPNEEIIAKKSKFIESATKPTFRPRYSKNGKDRTEKLEYQGPTKLPLATSRYSRKKAAVKTTEAKLKPTSTERPATQTKKLEFRPRTATYRRHSDVPTTAVESTTRVESTGVAITPRSPKYTAAPKTSAAPAPSVSQEPQLNLMIANDTRQPNDTGITGSSNGDSGNTNVFSPTRTAYITANNASLLEQLRSTVAPLLNSLGNKTPVFSSAYSNVNNANSGPRITPSGAPPRFSARYKGAELFVRKQNNGYQATVPSITSSSTTPVTPVENSGSAPPIEVSSPGEPRFLTLYQAVETASIRNEQLQGVQQPKQVNGVPQVDPNAPVVNVTGNNPNNDTTSPAVSTTSDTTQTPDTTTVQDSSLIPRLGEEPASSTTPVATTAAPENLSTTEQPSTGTESSSSTEQASTSTVSSSTDDQTITESPSTTEQVPTSTEPSTISTGVPPLPTQSVTPTTESTTMETSTAVPFDDTAVARILGNLARPSVGPTTVGYLPQVGSTELYGRVPTTLPTESPATSTETTVVPSTTDTSITSTSENVESNTIELSDSTSTQSSTTDSTTTTEADSNNLIDAETTTATIPVSTVRNRLIDFAQDILSRLQASMNTTTVPPQDAATTITPIPDISNAILDSGSRMSTLEVLAQLRGSETTTTQRDSEATTQATTTEQPGSSTTNRVASQSAVGSVTTPSPATATATTTATETETETETDRSSSVVTTQAASAQDQTDPVTAPNPPPTTTQDPQTTVSDDPSEQTGSTPETTTQVVASTTDTLLTELMSIAKTLISEQMNETRLSVESSNDDTTTTTTQAAEPSSTPPEVATVTPESTPAAAPELTTVSVDPAQNEVDSVESTSAMPAESSSDSPATTTPQTSPPDSEIATVPTSQTLGALVEGVASTTTPSLAADTTTQTQTAATRTADTTVATTANANDSTTPGSIATTETETTLGPVTEVAPTETVAPLTGSPTTQPGVDANTNQPEAATTVTVPNSILSRVNTVTSTPSTSSESNTEQTTVPPAPTTTPNLDSMDVAGVTTNQQESALTTTTMAPTEATTNLPDQTTNVSSQTTPSLDNETPTVARFQDTTSATAQGTAGSGIGQTTEIAPTTSPTVPSSSRSFSPSSPTVTTATPTTTTETPTSTESSTPTTMITTTTTTSTSTEVFTVTPVTETTVTTVDVNENLVSTEATPGTTTVASGTASPPRTTDQLGAAPGNASGPVPGPAPVPIGARIAAADGGSTAAGPTSPYLGRFGASRLTPAPRFSLSSTTRAPLRDYLIYGIYPNKTIVRKRPEDNLIDARNVDSPYVIFGIFPDGRLVRKFPNGTIIPDPPRNPVEVVFSLSTSTTTTTNRPPPRPYYNQANQGAYNRYQGPVYSNNRRPEPMGNVGSPGTVDLGLTGNAIVGPNGGGPDLTGPLGTPASVPTADQMSDAPLNTQMGTTSGAMSANAGRLTPIVSTGRPPTDSQGGRIVQDRERDEATRTKEAGGQRSSVYIGQDKFVNYWTDEASTTNPRVVSVNINSVATATNEGRDPSPPVPSFNNLLNNEPSGRVTAPPGFPWRDPLDQIFGITTSSPVITASVASNTLDDSADPPAARPINPFVEIFTPFTSAIANFVSAARSSARPPTTTAMPTGTAATTTSAPTTTTPRTTTAPTTTTTSTTTTTTTTTMAPTTTRPPATTTPQPVTNPVPRVTVTPSPTVAPTPNPNFVTPPFNLRSNLLPNVQQQNAFGTTFGDLAFLNSLLQSNTRASTTPKTLTQVEQLLANKILSLALSNNNPGPTRAPKAIVAENASPNSIGSFAKPSAGPIVIDLLPSSTATTPTRRPVTTPQQLLRDAQVTNNLVDQTTGRPISSTTGRAGLEAIVSTPSSISTTKAPVTVPATLSVTQRPRTTTQPTVGLGASLWQALFGGGLFGQATTPRPPIPKPKPKPVTAAEPAQSASVSITPKPVTTTRKPQVTQAAVPATFRSVDISQIVASTPNSIATQAKSATTPTPVSLSKQSPVTSPKPRPAKSETSTFSPEEDAKFLVDLLRAVQNDNKASSSKKSSGLQQVDESFLRAILTGRAFTTTTAAPSNEISNAALLAALLKAQGVEPSTPATKIREQLLLASVGEGVGLVPTASPTTVSTTVTVTTGQASTGTSSATTATRPTDTTKKTVTPSPRSTSRPRIRTTTWSPSSTYPPPLFSSFSNYGTPAQSSGGDDSGSGALFGATRAFSQLLGAAISGAAQQLQSLVRNGTRIVSEAVG